MSLERRLEVGQLVDQTAGGPNVGLRVVTAALPDLRRHVVGRAHVRLGHEAALAECPRQPEVPQFDVFLGVDEQVAGLEVPVHDLFAVELLQRDEELEEHLPDDFFGHELG